MQRLEEACLDMGEHLTALLVYSPAGSDICLGLAQESSKNGLTRAMVRGSLPGL